MDYVYFHPLLFLFVGFFGLLWQGEHSTVSKEQSRHIYPRRGRPQTSTLPGPDRLQSNSTTPTEGEAWLGLAGRVVALPIFPGRIPSDTTTNLCSDREVLSVVIIGDNCVR